MASILKVDKIRVSGGDSDSISFDNSGNITFNKTVTGDNNSLVKVASSSSSSGVSNVTFDNVVVATYDDYLLTGSVVGTDGANFSVDIYYRANDGSADYDVSTGSNGLAHYQGQWSNRAASSTYQGNVLNGSNAYLRLPISQDVYGGGIMTFTVHFHNLHEESH